VPARPLDVMIGILGLAAILVTGCSRGEGDTRLRASGSFEADRIKVVATSPGRLTSFSIDEGDVVELDQVVAAIESEDLLLKREEVEAALDMARAQLALVEKGARREDIRQLEALRKEVKLQKSLAEKNVERLGELRASGGVSSATLDEAETRRDVAGSKLSQIKWQLSKARNGAQEEEIEAARAGVAQLEAGLKQLDKLIADRTLKSPAAGKVLDTYVHGGEFVTTGQLLATISDLEVMELVVYVPQKDLARVGPGQKVSVHIDAFEDRWFPGRVLRIADEAEFTPSTVQTEEERVKLVFEVTVQVANTEGYFKPGMPGDVIFEETDGAP
jgi:HlyD family secretion protein